MDPLAILGFATILAFLGLTLLTRLPVIAVLVLVPVIAAALGGFGSQAGRFALEGIRTVAPVATMIMFAVLYFGLMLDRGLFEPLIRRVLAFVREDPLRLCIASALLPLLVALDGDGSTTFLIAMTALLPVHRRLGVDPLVLPCIVALAAGVMNMLPWGGPTARAMAVLHADVGAIFLPVLPAMAAGVLWVLGVAWFLGRRERRRLAGAAAQSEPREQSPRPASIDWRFRFNLALTALVIALLFRDLYASILPLPQMPAALIFMVAFAIALPINCPSAEQQKQLLGNHAAAVANVTGMVLAAGVFTGLLGGSGMTEAMARTLAGGIAPSLAAWLGPLVAITSMPMSLALPPDAYYFGVLPVFAQTAGALGQDPLVIGRAAILGQMTTGFPISPLTASTFILVGLAGVSLRDHQRRTFPWAFGTTVVMTVVAALTGALG